MTLEVSGIALKVDSTDAVSAKANLEGMAKAGGTAAAALGKTQGAAKTAGDAIKGTGQAAKMTAQQAVQMSNQLQDFFIQVQSGQNPLTALLQQGSQLSAVFGGAAPALSALGGLLFSAAAGYAALAAAGVSAAAALAVGREQSADLARALTLSGNAAGITEGQFNGMAQAIADATKTTIGSSRETLQGLAGSGRITSQVLTEAATAVQLLNKVTGQVSEEIVRDFAKAADAPAKFAAEANKSYNFLTASQLQNIQSLEEQGRKQEALALTLRLLVPRLEDAASKTTGLASAFSTAKREASAFLDGLLSIGRETTAEDQIQRIRSQLDDLAKSKQSGYVFGPSAADLQAQLSGLERTADAQRKEAAAAEQRNKANNQKIEWNALEERSLDKQVRKAKELKAANDLADATGASAKSRAAVLASINEKYKTTAPAPMRSTAMAGLQAELAEIRASEGLRVAIYRQSESVIDALRQAGTLSEREYYEAKRGFAALEGQAQEGMLQREIARLEQFKGSKMEMLQAEKQLAKARGELAEVQAGSATKAVLLNIQEKASVDALKRAFSEMEFAAANAFKATARRVDFSVGQSGLSDKESQRAADEFNIREGFTRQIEQLEADFRSGSLRGKEDEYRRRRELLLDNQEFELNQTAEGYRRLDAERARWQNGVSEAFGNYRDQALDTATQVRSAMERASQGMEDALVTFVTTGKLSFNDLATSIVADITRIIIKQQIMVPLMQAMGMGGPGGGAGGGGFLSTVFSSLFGGQRANGGPVSRGRMYEVNERGRPELLNVGGRQYLMATQSGSVNPNAGGAGGGVAQTNNFHFSGQVDRRTQSQLAAKAGSAAQRALARNN